jgi:hypothetical protein
LLPEGTSYQGVAGQEADDEVSMDGEAAQPTGLDLAMPASSLKRYFQYIEIAGELKAKCRLGCSKVIARKHNSTTSMIWHLEKFHNGL